MMNKNAFVKLTQGAAARRNMIAISGLIILASVICIASGTHGREPLVTTGKVTDFSDTGLKLQQGLNTPYQAPPINGIAAWLNSPPLTMGELRGKVVLIDFWTYGCINCVRTLPYLAEWDNKYRAQGLVIVGIHSPEFAFEKDLDNVRGAVAQQNIHYPVALDNHLDTWTNFENRNWPAHFLINREGQVVYTHFGEGEYAVTESNIRFLLGDIERKPREADATARPESQTRGPARGKEFKDCPACARMVVIPAGSFDIGPNRRRVTIGQAFALGKYEVTQAEWQAVMGSNPSHTKGTNLPVEQVNWSDIQDFLVRLNRKTGRNYRLPSEAEWEYACRAGRADEYCGGDDVNGVAWYGASQDASGNSGRMAHPVGTKRANAYGLYDMSGNVWEWVEDAWHGNLDGAPGDGSPWRGDGGKRVIRGGSWLDYPLLARADFRVWAGTGKRSSDLGFRLAMTLPKH